MVSPHPDEAPRNTAAETVELRKAVLSAFVGALIEWYDFFLYGTAAALVFPKLFFPEASPQAGTMAAFATYAVGFFARPVGSVIFGHLGDRFGRKATLVWTLTLMGGATFLIGCLPSYHTAGMLAPILLVVLRFGQGLAIGGEWGGAALMAVEHGHKGRRGLHGSWAQIGVPVGLLLANGAFALAALRGDDFLLLWGWRMCFWFGLVLTLVGLVIRKKVSETPLFKQTTRAGAVARNPLGEVLRRQWRKVLLVIGVRVAENAGFYILSVYVLSYAKAQLAGSEKVVQHALLLAAAVEAVAIPACGALSDRFGRRVVCFTGNALFALGIFPFFAAIDSHRAPLIWLAMVLMIGLIHAAMYAPQAAFFAELFPTNLRYSGASLGYGLTTPLAGGLAPLIAGYLVHEDGGQPWLMCAYVATLGVVSCVASFCAKETNRINLEHAAANTE
jgi:metabolite-proton symporter